MINTRQGKERANYATFAQRIRVYSIFTARRVRVSAKQPAARRWYDDDVIIPGNNNNNNNKVNACDTCATWTRATLNREGFTSLTIRGESSCREQRRAGKESSIEDRAHAVRTRVSPIVSDRYSKVIGLRSPERSIFLFQSSPREIQRSRRETRRLDLWSFPSARNGALFRAAVREPERSRASPWQLAERAKLWIPSWNESHPLATAPNSRCA